MKLSLQQYWFGKFNIQILTVMKRNFISSLVESNKKPNQNSKKEKTVKRSGNSIFQQHKENIHPNLTYQNSSKKNQKLTSKSTFKSNHKRRSSNKKVQTYQQQEDESFLSPFKLSDEKEERKQLAAGLKRQCMKVKKLLDDKKQTQIKKCRQYYEWLRQQICVQQKLTLTEINNCFQQAHNEVEKYMFKIDNLTSLNNYNFQFLIQLPLLTVSITQEMKQIVKLQLNRLNLLNHSLEIEGNKMQNKFEGIKFQKDNMKKAFQTPFHSENHYTDRNQNQKQVFEFNGIGDYKDYEFSPSFRHF